MVCLLGRQTDKPTRVLINLLPLGASQELLDQILKALQPKAELPDPSAPRHGHYLDLIGRRPYTVNDDKTFKPCSDAQAIHSIADDF